jgi:multidrug efflux system outer membrane protein
VKWFDLFRDEKLQELIRTALKNNYDIGIAAQRVLAAEALITVERAPLFPSVEVPITVDRQEGPHRGLSSTLAGGRVFWELDIWGRIRRSTEAARAEYLSQEAVQLGQQRNILTDQAFQHRLRFLNRRVQVQHPRLDDLLSAEYQQLPGKTGGTVTGLPDLLGVRPQWIRGLQ